MHQARQLLLPARWGRIPALEPPVLPKSRDGSLALEAEAVRPRRPLAAGPRKPARFQKSLADRDMDWGRRSSSRGGLPAAWPPRGPTTSPGPADPPRQRASRRRRNHPCLALAHHLAASLRSLQPFEPARGLHSPTRRAACSPTAHDARIARGVLCDRERSVNSLDMPGNFQKTSRSVATSMNAKEPFDGADPISIAAVFGRTGRRPLW